MTAAFLPVLPVLPVLPHRPSIHRRPSIRTMPFATVPVDAPPIFVPARRDGRKPLVPTLEQYRKTYERSVRDPGAFWREVADDFVWKGEDVDEDVLRFNFDVKKEEIMTEFLKGRKTNVCYNALDRWVEQGHGDRVAFYCEGNEDGRSRVVTYAQMLEMVTKFAGALKYDMGVKKGEVVVLYMPMIPELVVAMLACARIGAVHSVVFGGFSAEALGGRIVDSKARVVVTTARVGRGKKVIELKKIADRAVDIATESGCGVEKVIVTGEDVELVEGRDLRWDECLKGRGGEVEWMGSEESLFVLYTSGSTGKPKGVVHSTGGYMVFAGVTFKYSFDFGEGDVFFSTSDCGWITGHSYVTYGPMLNGATQVLYEGVPTYPDPGRLWEIVEKYKVTQLYTAPTVIRSLMGCAPPSTGKSPDEWVKKWDRSSLRVLGTVGEPINPEAWRWYFDVVGDGKCAVVDTWWQTETGGHMLAPLPIPGMTLKPGSAMLPCFGVEPAILNADGIELEGPAEGFLVIKTAWPSTLRTVFGDHKRMEETYFARFPGYYLTGDGARRDEDGHYWLTGRVDDILNVSGHRIGTAEVESALVTHKDVTEAAVVGVPHAVKGEGLYAYVSLRSGVEVTEELRLSIRNAVRSEIGPFAAPDTIHWAPALPKTRSGKIMRRILRKIAAHGVKTEREELGDTSTLTDPAVIDALLATYGK